MNELALFAGAGGGVLGGILCGFKTICYVEWEEYCIEIIKARIKDGIYEDAPIWNDVQTFDGKPWSGSVDIVTGGFPCQPFSQAGKRLGEDDPKNMWPSTVRIIKEVAPEWCLLENVASLLGPYFGQVITDLSEIGYDIWWGCLSASSVGAKQIRERLWIVAHRNSCSNSPEKRKIIKIRQTKNRQKRKEMGNQSKTGCSIENKRYNWWRSEPTLGRMVDGVAYGDNRIKAIGNGQVPAVVKEIWRIIGNGGKR